jgi:RNA polymerase sigma-70 factor (ECF subfamily)
LTIVRNLCRDRLRKPPENHLSDRDSEHPADEVEPFESISHQERRDYLIAAVDDLPEAQREVVALRLATDLKFEEIAGLLHVPLGTVLSRMHSAVQRLKQQLRYSHER